MHKTERFTFKLDGEERRLLEWLERRAALADSAGGGWGREGAVGRVVNGPKGL